MDAIYAGSGELLGMFALIRICDVFVPGTKYYLEDAIKNGWIDTVTINDLLLHKPVIIIPLENNTVQNIFDLEKAEARIALGNPKAAAIGRATQEILRVNGIQIAPLISTPPVNQLLVYVTMNQVDAAIVWQELTENNRQIRVIDIPNNQKSLISSAITIKGVNNPLSEKFNNFLSSQDAKEIFKEMGFEIYP